MAVLSELRYPTTRLAKIFSGLLALLLFGFVAISTVSGFLVYQILRPARTPTAFDLNVMMGHPTTFSFPIRRWRQCAMAGFSRACAARRR